MRRCNVRRDVFSSLSIWLGPPRLGCTDIVVANCPKTEHDVSDLLLARFNIYEALVAMVLQADPWNWNQRSLSDIQLLSHWCHVYSGIAVSGLSPRHHFPMQVRVPRKLSVHKRTQLLCDSHLTSIIKALSTHIGTWHPLIITTVWMTVTTSSLPASSTSLPTF